MFDTMIKEAEGVVDKQIGNIEVLEKKAITKEVTVTRKSSDCVDGFFCETPQQEKIVTGHKLILHPHQMEENASYLKDRKVLHQRLEDNYISPIAILPKQVFLQIVKRLDLYPFKVNDEKGKFNFGLRVDWKTLHHLPKGVSPAALKRHVLKKSLPEKGFLTLKESEADKAKREQEEARKRQVSLAGGRLEYQRDRYRIESSFNSFPSSGYRNQTYSVQFYRSKKDEMLDAIMGLLADDINSKGKDMVDTFIVADESAVDIPGLYEKYKEVQEIKERDPIICASLGDAIAILYQYGDFPQEKKFMRIIRSLNVDDYVKYLDFKHKPWGLRLKVEQKVNKEYTKFGEWFLGLFAAKENPNDIH